MPRAETCFGVLPLNSVDAPNNRLYKTNSSALKRDQICGDVREINEFVWARIICISKQTKEILIIVKPKIEPEVTLSRVVRRDSQ